MFGVSVCIFRSVSKSGYVSVCRLGPRGQERRTQADLETEGKLQADTLDNEQREHADTNRLSKRTKDADRYARQ